MSGDRYQVKKKAKYLKLLLLKDDLNFFHNMLQLELKDGDSWRAKLRYTRQVFIILNTVLEAINQIQIRGSGEYIAETRQLRKTLSFINHFRNKAVGHLDLTLLERAVQWTPALFIKDNQDEAKQSLLGQIAIIEACINSFLDEDGVQKVFKTEIDLMYPPNYEMFYEYLWTVVTQSINWLSSSLSLISADIKYHGKDEMNEIAAVAGQTEFNLQKESNLNFDAVECRERFRKVILKMKEIGTKVEIIDLVEKLEKTILPCKA